MRTDCLQNAAEDNTTMKIPSKFVLTIETELQYNVFIQNRSEHFA